MHLRYAVEGHVEDVESSTGFLVGIHHRQVLIFWSFHNHLSSIYIFFCRSSSFLIKFSRDSIECDRLLSHIVNPLPDGVTTKRGSLSRSLARDFGGIDKLSTSHLNGSVTGPGQVANHDEQLKIEKYAALAIENHFVPTEFEVDGVALVLVECKSRAVCDV